ncbi:glycosyltransferase family 4 protein [Mesobacillus maritimus]|uniref:glycosyltransferase family 4 protein n=1 Tax=Mesobacillus maritimus TaxID=1643336 RepID=UPI00203E9E57|nr:glycosyltransferase family 4 protein [Mesobacillus maritimus]MCM3586976.1 glycosyltransferase family 4 protein [Mesobacillus maritimus]
MKILYVTTISNTVNAFLIPHIKLLVEQGHQVEVAFNVVQDVSPDLIELGIKIHNVDFQRSPLQKGNLLAYKKIQHLVMEEGFELVHTHTPIASFITRMACRNTPNTKILYTAHGFHFYKGAPFKNWLIYYSMERVAAKYTDAIITINQEDYIEAQKLKLRIAKNIFKIHGVGIDIGKFIDVDFNKKVRLRKEYEYSTDDFILFYAAELNYNKHQDLLIDVVSILKDKIPNIKLLLAGEGPLTKKYIEQVDRLGLRNNIEFLGFRKDIPNLLKLSDIAVSASRREGLPVNIMEAMATGLPIVLTDCRGNRDLVINNENGILVDLEDKESFANAIKKVFDSASLRKNFSKRNLELINSYSIDNVIKEMRLIYNNFL